MKQIEVTTTYDSEVDAGYIAFREIAQGEAVRQLIVESELKPFGGTMILDFDADGYLLGIELLDVCAMIRYPIITD